MFDLRSLCRMGHRKHRGWRCEAAARSWCRLGQPAGGRSCGRCPGQDHPGCATGCRTPRSSAGSPPAGVTQWSAIGLSMSIVGVLWSSVASVVRAAHGRPARRRRVERLRRGHLVDGWRSMKSRSARLAGSNNVALQILSLRVLPISPPRSFVIVTKRWEHMLTTCMSTSETPISFYGQSKWGRGSRQGRPGSDRAGAGTNHARRAGERHRTAATGTGWQLRWSITGWWAANSRAGSFWAHG